MVWHKIKCAVRLYLMQYFGRTLLIGMICLFQFEVLCDYTGVTWHIYCKKVIHPKIKTCNGVFYTKYVLEII